MKKAVEAVKAASQMQGTSCSAELINSLSAVEDQIHAVPPEERPALLEGMLPGSLLSICLLLDIPLTEHSPLGNCQCAIL